MRCGEWKIGGSRVVGGVGFLGGEELGLLGSGNKGEGRGGEGRVIV